MLARWTLALPVLAAVALVIGSCGLRDEPGQEQSLGEPVKGGRPGGGSRCTVVPDPVEIGGDVVISASGFDPAESVRVDIIDETGTTSIEYTPDPDGTISVGYQADALGTAQVSVFRIRRGRVQLRASCSFEVVEPCTPTSCELEGALCGAISDGCGGTLECGSCEAPELCGGGGTPNVCGVGSCAPDTCEGLGASCGQIEDGCGGLLDCGGCSGGETCGGGGVPNVCGSSDWPPEWAQLEAEVLELINQHRLQGATCGTTSYGPAPALTMDSAARRAARLHSEDMSTNNYFSHTSLDGRSFLQRMIDAGWAGSCPCGENIAAGYGSASSVVSAWMSSPGHCSNIMSASYGAVGLGYAYGSGSTYGRYWTADFAQR